MLGGTVACIWVEFLFVTFCLRWPFSQRSRAYNSKTSFTESWAGKEPYSPPHPELTLMCGTVSVCLKDIQLKMQIEVHLVVFLHITTANPNGHVL
jgi:hypothetical protein